MIEVLAGAPGWQRVVPVSKTLGGQSSLKAGEVQCAAIASGQPESAGLVDEERSAFAAAAATGAVVLWAFGRATELSRGECSGEQQV